MPFKSSPMCHIPGCPNKADRGSLCRDHQKLSRNSNTKSPYGGTWNKARKMFLNENPLCIECMREGVTRAGTEVDHIIPHHGNYELFWDQSNWESLCNHHHSQKTMTEINLMKTGG